MRSSLTAMPPSRRRRADSTRDVGAGKLGGELLQDLAAHLGGVGPVLVGNAADRNGGQRR